MKVLNNIWITGCIYREIRRSWFYG